MSKRILPFLPLLLLPLMAARSADPVSAIALGEGERETLTLDSINRLQTSRGTLKVDLHNVERVQALDGMVRVYFVGGDVASGELKHPLIPKGASWVYVQAAPPVREEVASSPMVAWIDGEGVTLEQLESSGGGPAIALEDWPGRLNTVIDETLIHQEALAQGLAYRPKVRSMLIQQQLREQVYSQFNANDVSEEELQAYFQANRDDFVVPEKRLISTISYKVGTSRTTEQAEALCTTHRQAVYQGSSFKELAVEHSEDVYGRRGGDAGYVSEAGKPGLAPEVVSTAWELEKNQMACVSVPTGVALVQVRGTRGEVDRTFEQMKGSVMRKVKNEHYHALYNAYVAELRSTVTIETDPSVLEMATDKTHPAGPGLGQKGNQP